MKDLSERRHLLFPLSRFVLPVFLTGGAIWADVVVDNAVFSTTNQSMWQTGAAGISPPTEQYCFCLSWPSLGPFSPPFPIPVVPPPPFAPGTLNFTASLNAGQAGLLFQDQITAGAVNVTYPVRLTYSAPNDATPGQQVIIDTGATPNPGASLNTFGPALSASLSLLANISAMVDLNYSPLIGQDLNAPLNISTGGEQTVNLISIGSGASGITFDLPLPGFSFGAQLPNPLNLQTMQLVNGNQLKVAGSSSPPFLSLNLNLANLAVAALNAAEVPIPPLSAKLGLDSLASLDYTIFSLLLQIGPKFAQGFTFSANSIPVTLTANTGQTETGFLGDSFDFTQPANENLVVTATAGLDATLLTQTGFTIGADETLSALSGSLNLGKFSIFNFGPLFNPPTVTLAETNPIYLFNNKFPLTGFNSVQDQIQVTTAPALPGMASTPEPGSVALLGTAVACGAFLLRRRLRKPPTAAS